MSVGLPSFSGSNYTDGTQPVNGYQDLISQGNYNGTPATRINAGYQGYGTTSTPTYNPQTLNQTNGAAGNQTSYGAGYGQAAPGASSQVTAMNAQGQSTGSTINATAPASIQSFGGTAQVAPTYATAATVNPASAQQYLNQYEGAVNTALAPQFQQQDQALAQSDAARGITNSGSAGQLQTNLQGQQASALSSAYEPLIGQGMSNAQADTTLNATNQQTTNLADAAAGNTASTYNANAYNTDVDANASAYNNYQNELLQYGSGEQNSLLTAYLNSYGPNSGVSSAYNTGLSGSQSVYGNVLGEAESGQGSALGGIGQGVGTYLGDAAEAGS
jgi:hypothetical protein